MTYIIGKTYLKAEQWGRGWIVFWAGAGHRRPRVVYGEDKRAIVFPTKDAAMDAGLAAIQRSEPNLTGTVEATADPLAGRILAEVIAFKDRREEGRRQDRKIFRKGGKPAVIVETRRLAR